MKIILFPSILLWCMAPSCGLMKIWKPNYSSNVNIAEIRHSLCFDEHIYQFSNNNKVGHLGESFETRVVALRKYVAGNLASFLVLWSQAASPFCANLASSWEASASLFAGHKSNPTTILSLFATTNTPLCYIYIPPHIGTPQSPCTPSCHISIFSTSNIVTKSPKEYLIVTFQVLVWPLPVIASLSKKTQ